MYNSPFPINLTSIFYVKNVYASSNFSLKILKIVFFIQTISNLKTNLLKDWKIIVKQTFFSD